MRSAQNKSKKHKETHSKASPIHPPIMEDANKSRGEIIPHSKRASDSTHLSNLASSYGSLNQSEEILPYKLRDKKKYSTISGLPSRHRNFEDFLALYSDSLTLVSQDEENWKDVQVNGRMTKQKRTEEEKEDEESGLLQDSSPSSVPMNSNWKTFFTLMKSFVGGGVLFLPKAFFNGGIVFSIVLLVVFALISLHGMLRLIKTKQVYGTGSFADIGERSATAQFGPKGGRFIRLAVECTLSASQFGFCAAGCSFVANTIKGVFESWCRWEIPFSILVFSQLAFYLPIALTRKIQKLGPLAIFSDIFILFGIFVLSYYNIKELHERGPQPTIMFNEAKFTLFFGTIVYAFEGIGLIIPIEEAMEKPKDFPKLLSITVLLVSFFMVIIAIPSYLSYGEKVENLIFRSLPQVPLVYITQILYSTALFFTFPLMLFPGTKIIETWILHERSGKDRPKVKWSKNVIRLLCVLLITTTSYGLGDRLEIFVALIGAVCCGPLLFIFPALFHFSVAKSIFQKSLDVMLFVFGCGVTGYVSYQTIYGIFASK